jgi:hypothetical protein
LGIIVVARTRTGDRPVAPPEITTGMIPPRRFQLNPVQTHVGEYQAPLTGFIQKNTPLKSSGGRKMEQRNRVIYQRAKKESRSRLPNGEKKQNARRNPVHGSLLSVSKRRLFIHAGRYYKQFQLRVKGD